MQRAFIAADAFQCGFCTADQIKSLQGLPHHHPDPTAERNFTRRHRQPLPRHAPYLILRDTFVNQPYNRRLARVVYLSVDGADALPYTHSCRHCAYHCDSTNSFYPSIAGVVQ